MECHVKPTIEAILKRLQTASDVEQETLALGFVPDNLRVGIYGVGMADDGHLICGDFVLYDTTWRRRSHYRRFSAVNADSVPPLWVIELDRSEGFLPRAKRAWSRSTE